MIASVVEMTFAISGPSCTCSVLRNVLISRLNTPKSMTNPMPPTTPKRANWLTSVRMPGILPSGIGVPAEPDSVGDGGFQSIRRPMSEPEVV